MEFPQYSVYLLHVGGELAVGRVVWACFWVGFKANQPKPRSSFAEHMGAGGLALVGGSVICVNEV